VLDEQFEGLTTHNQGARSRLLGEVAGSGFDKGAWANECGCRLEYWRQKLDKIAETPQIGIRASANMWRNPMTSVPADGEANLSAGRPIVEKNMSGPHTTAVLKMPTRDTGHIQ
jgi:hypothetical protein